jgi:hypothetical protein
MTKVSHGFAYLDPEEGLLINSTGSTKAEARVYLSAIEIAEDVMARLECVPVQIFYEGEKETPHE